MYSSHFEIGWSDEDEPSIARFEILSNLLRIPYRHEVSRPMDSEDENTREAYMAEICRSVKRRVRITLEDGIEIPYDGNGLGC